MAQFPGEVFVDAPTLRPWPKGILNVATVTDVDANDRGLFSGTTFEQPPSFTKPTDVDFADYADCIRTADKEFEDGIDYSNSFQFTGYRAMKCRTVGSGSTDEWTERVERHFTALEEAYVGDKVRAYLQGIGEGVTPVFSDAGDGLSPREAAALLFGFYLAQPPMILTGVTAGFSLNERDSVEKSGGVLVASPGFGTVGSRTQRMFATSDIIIRRGPLITHIVPDLDVNEVYALTERQYSISHVGQVIYADAVVSAPVEL